MLASLQRLLDALRVARSLAHPLLAGEQQVVHLLGWPVAHKAKADQSMGHQVGQPFGVLDLGLASRHFLDVRRIGQHKLKLAVEQDGQTGFP